MTSMNGTGRREVLFREQKAWLRIGRLKSIETQRESWGAKEGLASARKMSFIYDKGCL